MRNYVETFYCNERYNEVKKTFMLISYDRKQVFALTKLGVNNLKKRL